MSSAAFRLLGTPQTGGILIIADHASNHVPGEIHLGIKRELLETHIAWDIGVAAVAKRISDEFGIAAFLGGVSRLVCDLNRYAGEPGVIPHASDGVDIPGNQIDMAAREARLDRYFAPYHNELAHVLKTHRPGLILSLHSFTPMLSTKPDEKRPWEIGILYNDYEAASLIAIEHLHGEGLVVGDQLPYSGKILNATMNRHAEANGIPYVGVEMRQDLVGEPSGQERFAKILGKMCHFVSEKLGEMG